MKIALCLSGHLRAFDQTFNALNQHLLSKYNIDIFIHTWDRLGYSCNYKSDRTVNHINSSINQINQLYNPKKIIIESTSFIEELKREGDEYAPHLKNCPKHVGHMASMFYKIYACNELRKRFELENNIKYDCIIRCRPDLMFNQPVYVPNFLEKNTVWIPKDISGNNWYTDQFAIGNSDSMDLYSSLYFDIPEYFRAKMEFYPEKFMAWGFNKKRISAQFSNFNFYIFR